MFYTQINPLMDDIKPAFQMVYNEDIIRRNPFDFKLVDVVPNDSQKRTAVAKEQKELWMGFICEDNPYKPLSEHEILTELAESRLCYRSGEGEDFDRAIKEIGEKYGI